MTSLRRSPVLALIVLLALVAGCGSSSGNSSRKKASKPSSTQSSSASGPCSYSTDTSGQVARKVDLPSSKPVTTAPTKVTISTDQGNIPVTLDADKTPCTVNSFLSLAKQGYFDKTPCHRLVTQGIFVLQCGDPTASGSGGPGYKFDDELIDNDPRLQPCQGAVDPQSGKQACTYASGTLAMANAGPGTNGSQFFLVFRDSPLPAAYTVFGRMTAAGLQVVKKVAAGGAKPADAGGNTAPRISTMITSVK